MQNISVSEAQAIEQQELSDCKDREEYQAFELITSLTAES